MPPPIDPILPDPRKRGLLGGLQRFGGLLGRNFDRNAIGGIDATMGPGQFTDDMRRSLRSNAIMSLGQMLASGGKTPIQEGLRAGQERTLGAWKLGRDRQREDATRAAMAKFGGRLGTPSMPSLKVPGEEPFTATPTQAPGLAIPGAGTGPPVDLPPVARTKAPPTKAERRRAKIAELEAKAQEYINLGADIESEGAKLMEHDPKMGMELMSHAAKYHENARHILDRAAQMEPKIIDQREGRDLETNEPVMYVTDEDGETKKLPIGAKRDIKLADLGGKSEAYDPATTKPGTVMEHTVGKDTAATLAQGEQHWKEEAPYRKIMSDATKMNAQSGAISAESGRMNAMVNMDQNLRQAYEAYLPKAQSGEAAAKLAVAHTMLPELRELRTAIATGGRNAVLGIKSGLNTHLGRLAANAADKVGRLRSGGAISKPEEARFMGQIVGWADLATGDQSGALQAIDSLIEEARQTAKSLDPTGVIRSLPAEGVQRGPRPPSVFDRGGLRPGPVTPQTTLRIRPR